ncbi:MAG: DUF2809 domain-containing protein [Thermodesulfobacteriota bacterium]|nr:DUF2809 domain-containing protein [Thermodesulfobacteriota bacterium]
MLSAVRRHTLLALLIVTPMGLLFKFYSGPGQAWFNDHGAGLLYEIFWILVVFFFLPERKWTTNIAVSVFTVTCVLEVLQLWHPPFLEKVRSYFLGRALIGTTFSWWDFPHYGMGSCLGWACIKRITKT